MEKKRIYVSDVHMGPGRKTPKGRYDYDWFSKTEADRFAKFLNHLNGDENIGEIILLGDIFDDWVCPIYEVPPTYEEIIKAKKNDKAIKSLKAIAANKQKKLIFMAGNHDMSITKNILEKHFPGIIY